MSIKFQRMCVGCHNHKQKETLLRFIIINESLIEDKTKKFNARGFYICNDPNCIKKSIKNKSINKILNRNLTEEELNILNSCIK